MKLILSLQAMAPDGVATTASVDGDTLTYNGEAYDLSEIPNGGMGVVPEGGPFSGDIERTEGVLSVPLRWQFSPHNAASVQPSEPVVLTIDGGPVPDPVERTTSTPEGEAG